MAHYFLTANTDALSATSISQGDNVIPSGSPTPFFLGHSMIRKISVIREFPEGGVFLKVHAVNTNAYAIDVNVSFIIEEM